MSEQQTLVLGASGQVGHALCKLLGSAALPAGRKQQTPDWLRLDLEEVAAAPRTLDALLAGHELAAIICSAGATDVERCEREPEWAEAANHTGPASLAAAAAERGVPFVFFSTDYVFDGSAAHPGPYAEDAATHPLSVYGRSKLDGEQAVMEAHPGALVLRTNVVFGPDPQGKNFLYTLRRLLSSGQTMRVPTDQVNNPTYNEDLATATLALLEARAAGIFNVAGPEQLSRYDFAVLAAQILGLDPALIEPVTTAALNQRAKRPLYSGLQIDKLRQTSPQLRQHGVEDAIRAWASVAL